MSFSSPELKVFKLYFSKLVDAIPHPERLAPELYSLNVISDEVLYKVMNTELPVNQRNVGLLLAVEARMVFDPDDLYMFLPVIRSEPSLVDIADSMSGERCKQTKECKESLSPPHHTEDSLPTLSQPLTDLKIIAADKHQSSTELKAAKITDVDCSGKPKTVKSEAPIQEKDFTISSGPEVRTFQHYFSKLAGAILDADKLACKLYSKGVVSAEIQDEMNTTKPTSTYRKIARLLAAVEHQIVRNPATLHTFLSVLREDPSLVYIADAMSDEFRQQLPPGDYGTSPPTMKELRNELKDFTKWFQLGLQLDVSVGTLNFIEASHESTIRQCCEMVGYWLANATNPTWNTITEALRNIGENVLAANIASKHAIQSCNSEEYPISGQSVVGGRSLVKVSSSSTGIKKRRSTAVMKPQIISREQWRACSYFASMMARITEMLEREVDLKHLLSFLRFHCHPLNPEALYVDRHILHASRVSEVIESLVPDHINYMETGLLEAIVETFCSIRAKELLQQYHDRYPHFRQLSDMPDPVPDERLDQARRKRLRAKCDLDFESARARDIKRVQMSIERATGIDHHFVTPAQHDEG